MRFIREKFTIFHFFFLQVSWYKDGRSVHFDGNHVSEQHGSLFMLRLKQITINDLGNYTCEAENSQGLARDHIELSGNVYRRTDFRKAKHRWYLFLRDSFIIVYKNFFSRLDFFFPSQNATPIWKTLPRNACRPHFQINLQTVAMASFNRIKLLPPS